MNLCSLSASQAISAIREHKITTTDLVNAYVAQIEHLDLNIHAWAYFDKGLALKQAKAIDQKIAAGEPMGSLAGIPIGVKDVMNTRDMPTQMGSPIWDGFQPGNDARVVYYLRMADAVIMGKTVTAEFAVHTPGPTRNPQNLYHSPGTSSSGSAAAVSAHMVPLALGTQTAGSVIRPASYCGIYGFKPSFGLIPRTAILKTTDTLDTIGMFARSVEDLKLLFETTRVRGRDFPISERMLAERMLTEHYDREVPWRVAYVTGPKWYEAEPYARSALSELASHMDELDSFEVEAVSLPPEFDEAHDIHSVIYDKTLAYYFRKEFKQHTLVSPIMYDIITRGNQVTLDDYKAALRRQRELAASLDATFRRYDVVLNLSTGGEAPLWGAADRPDNCLIWTLCGVPAVSMPMFLGPSGLSYGLQVVGRRYADYRTLRFCEVLASRNLGNQSSTTWTKEGPSNGFPTQASRQSTMGASERQA